MPFTKLGNKVKLERLKVQLSQQGLCDQIFNITGYKLTQTHLSDIEKGRTIPKFHTFQVVIQGLQLDWGMVKEDFLASANDPVVLLDVIERAFQDKDHLFAGKSLNKLFRLTRPAKTSNSKKMRIRAVFYSFCHSRENNERMLAYLIRHLSELPKKELMDVLLAMFLYSKESNGLQSYSILIVAFLNSTETSKEVLFRVHLFYSVALYNDNRFVEALLEALKADNMTENMNILLMERFYLSLCIANACMQLGLFEKALEAYNQCTGYVSSETEKYLQEVYIHLAYMHYKLKNYVDARKSWDLVISTYIKKEEELFHVLPIYCCMELNVNDISKAQELFNRADEYAEMIEKDEKKRKIFHAPLGIHKRNKGIFALIRKDYKMAIREQMNSIDLLKDTPYREELLSTGVTALFSLGHAVKDTELIRDEDLQLIRSLPHYL